MPITEEGTPPKDQTRRRLPLPHMRTVSGHHPHIVVMAGRVSATAHIAIVIAVRCQGRHVEVVLRPVPLQRRRRLAVLALRCLRFHVVVGTLSSRGQLRR